MQQDKRSDFSGPEWIPMPEISTYRFRAVTYEVTAHFSSGEESLKSKIDHLLVSELQKQNSICTFAGSHRGDVK